MAQYMNVDVFLSNVSMADKVIGQVYPLVLVLSYTGDGISIIRHPLLATTAQAMYSIDRLDEKSSSD